MKHLIFIFSTFCILNSPFSILNSAQAAPAPIPQTGQTTCYDAAGAVISCTGTGQDGDKKAGVAWPSPRFTDKGNGTVTDNLTGLIWLKNANCTDTVGGKTPSSGLPWADAITWSNAMASGKCGLTDGSTAGQWRLPTRRELTSLVNRQQANNVNWLNGQGFRSVLSSGYWSSSTYAGNTTLAWCVGMNYGHVDFSYAKTYNFYVWPVRGGE